MFRNTCLVLACCLFAFSTGVSALGLGEIKLKSGLNQPLSAEIELFSADGMSEFEVAASLSSLVEFEKAGIDYFGYLRTLRFKTASRDGGRLVIEVTTRQPVKEPFLNFLVELNWPKGRMLREYTLLLDPPVFQESGAAKVQQAQSSSVTNSRPAQKKSPTYSASRRPLSPSQPAYSGNSYGPVGKNETLWRIATQVRPINASIHQTLVALYRANPQAFLNNDINLLKAGEVLAVPNAEDIAAIPRRAALQDMVARINGRNPGDTILDTSGRATDSSQVVRGEDRLKLASPTSGSGTSGSGAASDVRRLKSQLAQSREATATLKAENSQLRRKLQDALAVDNNEQPSGLAVDSTAGAILANQNDDTSSNSDEATDSTNSNDLIDDDVVAADVDDSSDSSPFGSDDDDDLPVAGDEGVSVDSTGGDSDSSSSSDSGTDSVSSGDAGVTTPSNTISTVNTGSQSSGSMFDDPMYLAGGAGLVVLLAGSVFFFWRMRQRMGDDEFQDDLVSSAQGGNFDMDESLDMPDVGDDLLGDLDSGESYESDSPSEADPLGEADIYIAYGKYDQAEKLLKEAIEENPSRTDLKVKLLECYAETKNRESFDATEAEYASELQANSANVQEVSSLRNQAWPGEDAPQDDFELPSTEEIFSEDDFSTGTDDDFSLDDLDTDSDVSIDDMVGEDSGEGDFDTGDMDFDIGEGSSSPSTAETLVGTDADVLDDIDLDDDFSLDGDLDGDILGDSGEDSALDDFDTADIELDLDDSDSDISLEVGSSLDDDLGSLGGADDDLEIDLGEDFDLGEDDGDLDGLDDEFADGADEASTKLDLARAYIDMGDAEGAKEILNEVIEEGNEGHKTEALGLLEKI